jgi:hypothetical protein
LWSKYHPLKKSFVLNIGKMTRDYAQFNYHGKMVPFFMRQKCQKLVNFAMFCALKEPSIKWVNFAMLCALKTTWKNWMVELNVKGKKSSRH